MLAATALGRAATYETFTDCEAACSCGGVSRLAQCNNGKYSQYRKGGRRSGSSSEGSGTSSSSESMDNGVAREAP